MEYDPRDFSRNHETPRDQSELYRIGDGVREDIPFRQVAGPAPARIAVPSPVAAGDHVFITHSDGKVQIVQPGPHGRVVATNDPGPTENLGATPFFQGRRIYWRTRTEVICIGER